MLLKGLQGDGQSALDLLPVAISVVHNSPQMKISADNSDGKHGIFTNHRQADSTAIVSAAKLT